MSDPAIRKIVCRRCYAILDAGDNFCRHCGQPTRELGGGDRTNGTNATHGTHLPGAGLGQQSAFLPRSAGWSDNPWVVIPLAILVLGPFGLPMVWRSRAIPPVVKLAVTAVLVGLTLLIAGLMWHVLNVSLAPLRELDKLKGL